MSQDDLAGKFPFALCVTCNDESGGPTPASGMATGTGSYFLAFAGNVIISLIADITVEKGYYTYSADPNLSLAPLSFEWDESVVFENLNLMSEPDPTIKYEKSFYWIKS